MQKCVIEFLIGRTFRLRGTSHTRPQNLRDDSYVKIVYMKKKKKIQKTTKSKPSSRKKRVGERNKNAGQIGGEAELSPSGTARPVSETRRFKSGDEGQDAEEGRRRLLSLKYVDPRATLGLFSLHPAGCSRRIPVRPERGLCISYDTKTSHYFPLSLDRVRAASSLPSSSYSSPLREEPAGM